MFIVPVRLYVSKTQTHTQKKKATVFSDIDVNFLSCNSCFVLNFLISYCNHISYHASYIHLNVLVKRKHNVKARKDIELQVMFLYLTLNVIYHALIGNFKIQLYIALF